MTLNRNGPTWLWTFSFILFLLPLTLGQAGPGGCGASVSAPNPNGNLAETIVDSDGDGFSDDEEINGTPGTDPDDPTDSPNNVRDSDADGCSNYDELSFENFCDNDPNTPPACDTTLYNAYYGYGFDLPADADELYALHWTFTLDGVRMDVSTLVEVSPPVSLEDYVTGLSQEFTEGMGSEVISIDPVQLSSGTPAYFVIMTTRVDGTPIWDYSLYAIVGPYLYHLTVDGLVEDLSEAVSDEASRILDSLCIG